MTSAELFGEGINLMVSGMGFTIFFLLILIYAIQFMTSMVNKYFPEPVKPVAAPQAAPAPAVNDIDRLRPVIAVAIAHHRKKQGL